MIRNRPAASRPPPVNTPSQPSAQDDASTAAAGDKSNNNNNGRPPLPPRYLYGRMRWRARKDRDRIARQRAYENHENRGTMDEMDALTAQLRERLQVAPATHRDAIEERGAASAPECDDPDHKVDWRECRRKDWALKKKVYLESKQRRKELAESYEPPKTPPAPASGPLRGNSIVARMARLVLAGVPAEHIVYRVKKYHRERHDPARHTHSPLVTAKATLTRLKRLLLKHDLAPPVYCEGVHLSRWEYNKIKRAGHKRFMRDGTGLPALHGENLLRCMHRWLVNPEIDPMLRVLALAAVTGRRTSEIICDKTEVHRPRFRDRVRLANGAPATHDGYWCNVSGLAKKMRHTSVGWNRDIPLLAPRRVVCGALREVRAELAGRCATHRDVNRVYGQRIKRCLARHCPVMGKAHNLRRFYVLMAHAHFNERGLALDQFAKHYLGHARLVDGQRYTRAVLAHRSAGDFDFASEPDMEKWTELRREERSRSQEGLPPPTDPATRLVTLDEGGDDEDDNNNEDGEHDNKERQIPG